MSGGRHRRTRLAILTVAVVTIAVELAIALAASHHAGRRVAARAVPATLAVGTALDKRLPALALIDEHGRATSLAAFRGRYVVLAPSLTLCHEVCPLTLAALTQLQAMLRSRGLGDRVVVAQATVDPWRDSPARLRAFRRRTRSDIRFLTGTKAQIRRLWRVFGVAYRRVPQGRTPDVDWWTHQPERFDVEHTDGLFLIDPRGHWRILVPGMPDVGARLPARLASLLDDEGRANLRRPDSPWSPAQVLDDLLALMGRPVATPRVQAPTGPIRGGGLVAAGATALRSRLAGLRGRPVVVNEWASWCPPCQEELPLLAAAASRYGSRVAFVGIDVQDKPAAARRMLAAHPLGYPSYSDPDGSAARSLARVVGLPTTVFLSADGKVTFVHAGEYRDAAALAGDIESHALR